MARLKNIQKVAQALGGEIDRFADGSGSWVSIENHDWVVNICFDDKGDKFQEIILAKKIYQVVDNKVIASVQHQKSNP